MPGNKRMKSGQAALEYFILFSIIVGAVVAILFAYAKGNNQGIIAAYITGSAESK